MPAVIDDLVEEVGKLTTAATDLLNTVNVGKVELDTAVTNATRYATSATNQATAAAQQATNAKQQAASASTSAVQAQKAASDVTAVATGGTASLTAAAGKIPIADNKKEIDKNYLNIYIRDGYRYSVEAATGGKNTVLYDAHGNANVMVVIPKFTYGDIGMSTEMGTGVATAFIRSGTEIPEIFIGKYLGAGAHGVSTAGADPKVSIDFDQAKSICESKGTGWHLMTVHEWAAIALWCMANGYQPKGNTQYGRAYDVLHEFGRRGDGRSPNDREGVARTNTGTGPVSWAHDNTNAGVYDLVGNVWEWQYGLKTQNGRVICTPDNEFTTLEAQWTPQECYFDNPLKLNSQVTSTGSPSAKWKGLTSDTSYASNELMQRLLIEPTGLAVQGQLYVNNNGERLPIRGGGWRNGSNAGLAALNLNNARGQVSSSVGFRPAFVA